MMPRGSPQSALRAFLPSEAGRGILLMPAAALAMLAANASAPIAQLRHEPVHRRARLSRRAHLVEEAKIGIVMGSLLSALVGDAVLRFAPLHSHHTTEEAQQDREIAKDGDVAR